MTQSGSHYIKCKNEKGTYSEILPKCFCMLGFDCRQAARVRSDSSNTDTPSSTEGTGPPGETADSATAQKEEQRKGN